MRLKYCRWIGYVGRQGRRRRHHHRSLRCPGSRVKRYSGSPRRLGLIRGQQKVATGGAGRWYTVEVALVVLILHKRLLLARLGGHVVHIAIFVIVVKQPSGARLVVVGRRSGAATARSGGARRLTHCRAREQRDGLSTTTAVRTARACHGDARKSSTGNTAREVTVAGWMEVMMATNGANRQSAPAILSLKPIKSNRLLPRSPPAPPLPLALCSPRSSLTWMNSCTCFPSWWYRRFSMLSQDAALLLRHTQTSR